MLAHRPYPTLHSSHQSPPDTISDDDVHIKLHLRTAPHPWKTHHPATTTIEFVQTLPSSRASSPSRSSTFLPFLKLAKDRSISPEPVSPEEAAEFEHTLASESLPQARGESKPGKIASWFSGSSEPVNITLVPSPAKGNHDPFFDFGEMDRGSARSSISPEADNMTRRPQGRLQKSTSSLSVVNKDAAGSNKFAFWRSRPITNAEKFIVVEDKFTGLDVPTALFPSGMMDDASPEHFRQLQANAEHTISRLQTAYKKSLQSAREVTSEKNVLNDELEAAQTRSEHLKLQVANMATDAAKKKSAMQSMADELIALRCKIREDAEFRRKSLRIATKECSDAGDVGYLANSNSRSKRQSADSFISEESSSDSVFSQPPLGTCTPISTADDGQDLYQALEYESLRAEAVKECQNCHGVRRAEAWDVVHVLKEESRALKARIAQCESANADALVMLDMVSAVR